MAIILKAEKLTKMYGDFLAILFLYRTFAVVRKKGLVSRLLTD